MSSFFAERQRKEARAADIMTRTSSLARGAAPPARGGAVHASASLSSSHASKRTPDVEKLTQMDAKDIANALMHASPRVRAPIIEQLNSSTLNKLNITRQIVEALGKPVDLQPYQSVVGAFDALAGIDIHAAGSTLPSWLKDSMVALFVAQFTTGTDMSELVVRDVQRLNLHLDVALKLLDWIDATCQTARVYRALDAIQKLGVATPEITVRILSQMQHFSPVPLEDLASGRKEPACLETAISVIENFHDTSFSVKVLEAVNKLLLDPPVYSTRNHAPTQRRRFVSALINLLRLKFAPRIRKFQETQEVSRPFE